MFWLIKQLILAYPWKFNINFYLCIAALINVSDLLYVVIFKILYIGYKFEWLTKMFIKFFSYVCGKYNIVLFCFYSKGVW